MAVRVKRQRAAMRQNMAPQCRQIRPGRLGRREVQRRQPARCVVDEDDQRAAGAAVLQPGVRAAVDLDQFAEPRPPLAQLKHPLVPPPLRAPQAHGDLHLAHRLRRNHDPVAFQQLLHRQGGAKVRILVAQQRSDPRAFAWRQPVVRGPTALARHQAGVSMLLPRSHQALELADPDPQTLGRLSLGELLLLRLVDQMQAFPLLDTHP